MATITEVDNDIIEQVPMPNTEETSMASPKPEPRQSSHIADWGARPELHNQMMRDHVMVTHEIVTEPENLKEAEGWPDWPIWKQAMKIEMDQHKEIGTWETVKLEERL